MRHRTGIVVLSAASALAFVLVATGARAPQDTHASDFLTAEVEKGDLSIEVELPGSFVAEDKDEIRVEPESYRGELIVVQLVSEGQAVKKGDPLIAFDPKSIEDSLEEAREEQSAKEIELEKARADYEAWRIETDRTAARGGVERDKAKAALDKAREEAALTLEDKQRAVADAQRRLHDSEVDFEQLTQLYQERELHTATENILIERQRYQLENSRRAAEKAAKEYELWEAYDKSQAVVDKELEFDDKEAEVRKAEIKAAAEQKEKEAAVSKAERALQKAKDKVADLEQDVQGLRVVSPRDGIVFYGTIGFDAPSDVIFVGMGGDSDQMKIGGRVRTHSVLMTVASMEHLSVRMQALESDIQHLKEGLPIVVRPDAFPSLAIDGDLTKVDQIASRAGYFSDVRQFTVRGKYDKSYPQLRSGMNCRVTVAADSVPECLQVPVLAVFSEGGDHYCLVVEGKKTSKRKVEIGAANRDRVEIKEGLRAGERVALHDVTAG